MNLLWHVIKKDLSALRWWMLAWVAACIAHLTLRLVQLHGGNEALPGQFSTTSRADFLAVVLLSILIIPQIVQLDPPGAGQAFWKTIPLSRRRLFFAKSLLLLAVFLIFPFILEGIYFALAGYGAVGLRSLEMWSLRFAPILLIVAAAAALARDRRVAALLIGAMAILILESAQSGLSLAHPETIASSLFTTSQLWSGLLACWLGLVSIPLFAAQYFLTNRLARTLLLAALAATYAVRAHFVPQVHWSPSEEAVQALAKPGAPYATIHSTVSEKSLPKPIPLPPGAEAVIDPLPSYVAFVETARHGEYSYAGIRVAVRDLPKDVVVSQARLTNCTLAMPSKTLAPVKPEDRENNYGGMTTVGSSFSIPDVENTPREACLCLPGELFAASYDDLAKEPGVITGKVRLTLTRLTRAGRFPLQAGGIWNRELHDFRIESAQRSIAGRDDGIEVATKLTTTTVGKPASFSTRSDYPTWTNIFLRNDLLKINVNVANLAGDGPIVCNNVNQNSFYQLPVQIIDMTRERMWERITLGMSYTAAQSSGAIRGMPYYRLISDLGDLERWSMDLERRDDLGEVELPFRTGPLLPAPVAWTSRKVNEVSQDETEEKLIRPEMKSRAFRQALAAIQFRDANDRKEIDDYLNRIVALIGFAPNALNGLYQNEILNKLSAVGPENLDALLSCARTFTMPEASRQYGYSYNSQNAAEPDRLRTTALLQVICDLTRETDKPLILKYLSPRLDLYEAVEQHGWQKEALPIIAHFAALETIPDRWLDILVKSGNADAFAGILAQVSHGGCDPNVVLQIGQTSAISAQDLAAAAWQGVLVSRGSPFHETYSGWTPPRKDAHWLLRSFSRACSAGAEGIPRDLLCILQMKAGDWSSQGDYPGMNVGDHQELFENVLLNVFSRYSECPTERNSAFSWLMKNAARMRFNAQTHRYETL